ncbi:MAG: FAD:protein FMN transferase [Mariprofundaceae bacterium]
MRIKHTLLALLFGFSACSPTAEVIHETHFMMGTLVEFTIAESSGDTDKAITAAAEEMQRIENLFTIYGDQQNAVKTFNTSKPGTNIELPKEIASLLNISLQIAKKTHGAFDPTLANLNKLWGFSQSPPPTSPPNKQAIEAARSHIHCIKQINANWQRNTDQCQLDFGAIAKGFAIDRGIEVLQSFGIHNAIINAGGDMRIIGNKYGQPWRIGLKHPRKEGAMIATLPLQGDISIVTSGDYERFYIHQGKRYHHILDSNTGYPAKASQSATVIASNATLADAWSTALFVLGEKGLKLAQQQQLEVLLIDKDGNIHTTPSMKVRLQ